MRNRISEVERTRIKRVILLRFMAWRRQYGPHRGPSLRYLSGDGKVGCMITRYLRELCAEGWCREVGRWTDGVTCRNFQLATALRMESVAKYVEVVGGPSQCGWPLRWHVSAVHLCAGRIVFEIDGGVG